MTKEDLERIVTGLRLAEQSLMNCRRGGAFRRQDLEAGLRELDAARSFAQDLLEKWGGNPPPLDAA